MANLRQKKGIDYFENVDFKQIVNYSSNPNPICGECLKNLLLKDDLILIPILNEVYCNKCGMEQLDEMRYYPEDDDIQTRRTTFWRNYLIEGKIKEY